jgi:LacI family transcriptional regulator
MTTIADIAREAGVHKSTVSRVLGGAELASRFNRSTRERILRTASSLGYQGNPLAQALRGTRSRLLGVIVPTVTHPFRVTMIDSIEEVARQRGYYVLVSETTFDPAGRAQNSLLTTTGINALVLVGESGLDLAQLRSVLPIKVLVSAAHSLPALDIPALPIDYRRSIQLALEHLIGLGHREIALICSPDSEEGRARVSAFRDCFAKLGLPEPTDFIYAVPAASNRSAGAILADGAALFDVLWARSQRPTAVIGGGSLRSAGLLRAVHTAGLRVPEDLSIVATADGPLVAYTTPALTSVDEHIAEIGRDAAMLLLDLFEGKQSDHPGAPPANVAPPELIVRESTARREENV